MRRLLTAAAMLSAAIATPAWPQNLFTNGGFEGTPGTPGFYTNYSTGQSFGGWTATDGTVSVIDENFNCCSVYAKPHSGTQVLDLTGPGAQGGGIFQTVNTVIGQTYNLSFWIGNAVSGPLNSLTSGVNVYLNNGSTAVFTAVNSQNGGNVGGTDIQVWQQFATSFVATNTTTKVAFVNIDPDNDDHNLVDDFVLTAASPVPEPGTWAMMLIGVGAVGGTMRRRRRTATRFAKA